MIIPSLCLGLIMFGVDGSESSLGTAAQPIRVTEDIFDLHYEVDEASLPLDRVELFSTLDQGQTWRSHGMDEDRQPPFVVQAAAEGLYGFFLLTANKAGTSSLHPTKGTKPQVWVLVDYTPPVVQLHELRQVVSLGQHVLQIRWTAIDNQLLPRPISVSFRNAGETTWNSMFPESIANTGRMDWRIPTEIKGQIEVRITCFDEGGHQVESKVQSIDLSSTSPSDAASVPPSKSGPTSSGIAEPTPKAKLRADQLYGEALALKDSGLEREAIARLREVVKLNPRHCDALADMGLLLVRLGDSDRALSAFDTALKIQPNIRAALRGAAQVHEQRRDYAAAADRLRTILQYNSSDAEAWMKLGDMAVYQGDELTARDCYARAMKCDPQAAQVIADAKKRMSFMIPEKRP